MLLRSKAQINVFNYVLCADKHVDETETYFHRAMFAECRIHTDRKHFSKKRKGFNLESKGKQNFSRKANLFNVYQFYVNTILVHSVLP